MFSDGEKNAITWKTEILHFIYINNKMINEEQCEDA